jgi:hypothetical protein
MPRRCVCNFDKCAEVPPDLCHLVSIPVKIGDKKKGPGRSAFTDEHLEAWCYRYLGYAKRDPVHVTQVADLVKRRNQKGRAQLCICDHHFEDCFVRGEQPNLKISMVHRDGICTAGREYRQDGSHAKEAWPVPSAKPATFLDVARSRRGLASKSAVRTAALVPVSRDVSTTGAEPIQTPVAGAVSGGDAGRPRSDDTPTGTAPAGGGRPA